MIKKGVIKRDGEMSPFSSVKIRKAVEKAFEAVDGSLSDEGVIISNNISKSIEGIARSSEYPLTVEDIQDAVERELMESSRKDVARAYITYRDTRSRVRERKSPFRAAIREKVYAKNVQNQNANVDEYSFGGRKGEAESVVLKQIALDEVMSPESKKNHEDNLIYIHDLDSYALGMHNCLSVPFDKLLANGFNTRQTDVRPANSVNTAFQLVAVLFQLQSLQQFGGVSATHLDWTMEPYVKKSFMKHYISEWIEDQDEFFDLDLEDMFFSTYVENITNGVLVYRNKFDDWIDANKDAFFEITGLKEDDFYFDNNSLDKKYRQSALKATIQETQQAVEGMYHNLNTLQSRSGNQLPFTSINYGTCTSREGRLVTKALLDGCIKGVGALHKTSVFPCGIFQYMGGVNDKLGTPNYDLKRLALQSTSKRLYPNYANVDWSGNAGYDINDPKTYFSTMGCRTANGMDINGFGQLKDGRGNICPVTIILPSVAMLVSGEVGSKNVSEFLDLLDTKIHEAKDMLIERFDWICSQDPSSAKFMYENGLMEGYVPEEGIRSALKHGTLALGQLGLAECLQILIGTDHTTEEGMNLAKQIESLFKKRCAEFKEEYKLNIGVYYTPAESLCYTAMNKFRAKYGELPNISDRDYFTNSIHVPVWEKMSPFDKIDIESQLTGYSNAGCITYVEVDGSTINNIDALEEIVDYAMEHDIPYFAVNVPADICLDCGYQGEFNDSCPECGSTHIQQLRRVTGYLTGDYHQNFNPGKVSETDDRVKHVNQMTTLEGDDVQ